jgi:drug/metabolite transporter (DMT)-like permease
VTIGTGLKAFLFAFAAVTLFSLEATFARAIGPGIDLGQIGVIRALVQLAFLWAWRGREFREAFATSRASMHITRGLLSVTGLAAYFYVFANLPMATATVLSFAGVLFTTVAAQVVLCESVGWRRWAATIMGFAGVLIVLQPGITAFDWVLLAGFYMAANGAAINLATKGLTRTEPTQTIMIWISMTTLLASLPLAMVTYSVPTTAHLALMIGIGVTGTLGQYASISAYRLADISAIAPVLYVRIVIATVIGYLVFSEAVQPLTVFGAAIVTASALYITIRESRLAREREIV